MYELIIVLVVLAGGSFLLARRNRARMIARETAQRSGIGFGSHVMTTSGLYGTVVALNDDDSVQLSIAPGVEVKWTMAALRDVSEMPARYRGPINGPGTGAESGPAIEQTGEDPDAPHGPRS